jgi:predicted dehydrogenase
MTIRVGIIGSNFGARFMAPAYEAAGGFQVVDVVSARDTTACRELAQRRDIGLVSVHSPVFLHAEHVRAALDAGHAVLCDKPLTAGLAESLALVEAAREASLANFVNFEFRFLPLRQRLRSLLADGELGTLEHVSWQYFTSMSRMPLRPWSWVFDEGQGGGWLRSWGVHAVDGVRHLAGDLVPSACVLRTAIAERPDREGRLHQVGAEDGFSAIGTTPMGASVMIDSSFAASASFPETVTVVGSEATAVLVDHETLVLRRADRSPDTIADSDANPATPPVVRALRRQLAALAQELTGTGDPTACPASFADGAACDGILDAFRRSA